MIGEVCGKIGSLENFVTGSQNQTHVDFRGLFTVHFGNHFEWKLRFRIFPGPSLGIPTLNQLIIGQ